ncbi:chorismate mutase [Candidatus Peregrinibacteria bacterium]|jgi:chorismate mutase|nr:chorismate mutase [Candidatus Peregrinibacteria bacterium]MBT6730361.1 chorismate mutase [Candidatus Peregrinibacteria bacterium]MBT7344993.1 chorismate mutase [Candidatus Peregrinibacteria bacterium]
MSVALSLSAEGDLNRLRDEIDKEDRELFNAIDRSYDPYYLPTPDEVEEIEAECLVGLIALFQNCPTNEVEAEAARLIDAIRRQFNTEITRRVRLALLNGFEYRSKVRALKTTTVDPDRKGQVINNWRENARRVRLDPNSAEALFEILHDVSARLQDLQANSTNL